jgi:hypothetical protein
MSIEQSTNSRSLYDSLGSSMYRREIEFAKGGTRSTMPRVVGESGEDAGAALPGELALEAGSQRHRGTQGQR